MMSGFGWVVMPEWQWLRTEVIICLSWYVMLLVVEWWGAGVVTCLERGADLHMAQLMPLPLTISCFCKIQTGFTFLSDSNQGLIKGWSDHIHLMIYYVIGGCRHQSKFRRLVQDDSVKSKAAHRTMGPAKVETKPPDQFLKKHEKDPKMPQSKLPVWLFISIFCLHPLPSISVGVRETKIFLME